MTGLSDGPVNEFLWGNFSDSGDTGNDCFPRRVQREQSTGLNVWFGCRNRCVKSPNVSLREARARVRGVVQRDCG